MLYLKNILLLAEASEFKSHFVLADKREGRNGQFSLCPSELMCVLGCSVMPASLQPQGLQAARPLCPWDSPARILEWGAIFSRRGPS